jgi:hypothetical protein
LAQKKWVKRQTQRLDAYLVLFSNA